MTRETSKKKIPWLIAAALALALIMCACAERTEAPEATPAPEPEYTLKPLSTPIPRDIPELPPVETLEPLPTPTPTPSPTPRVNPTQVYFPSFEEETPIVPVGMDKTNKMATISKPDVATWYRYGATPGDPEGNAIFAGHVSWGGRRGDFALLHDIPLGDSVLVTLDNGEEREFTVVFNETYPLSDVPEWVMDLRGEGRLTLITCAGDFDPSIGTSESRTVVLCVLKE